MPRHRKVDKPAKVVVPSPRLADAADIGSELVQADAESRQKIEEYLKLASDALRTSPSTKQQYERSKRTA